MGDLDYLLFPEGDLLAFKLPLQSRIPLILDVIGSSTVHVFCYFNPAVTMLLLQVGKFFILPRFPWPLRDIGVQVIAPPSITGTTQFCDRIPYAHSIRGGG